jgi:alkanesulfonate monooxygenase SsuD/methylene tetrahydromethanopterin reductase-like flavin-dependent oxidoreductase (luciferase family)
VKIGITLPQFGDEAAPVIEAACAAEALGIDGVFCFDHVWPIGQPDRPALSSTPLLGAIAASTSSIWVGSLVSRIGLVPDEAVIAAAASLALISKDRMIAGIGTGDHLTRSENHAFGIPYGSADTRRSKLLSVGSVIRTRGIPVWIGGGHPRTIDVARRLGVAVNLWEGDLGGVADLTRSGLEVTWGGPVPTSLEGATSRLTAIAAAGATWAVWAWPGSLDTVAEVAARLRTSD